MNTESQSKTSLNANQIVDTNDSHMKQQINQGPWSINELDVYENYKNIDVYDKYGCNKYDQDNQLDPFIQEIERDRHIQFFNRMANEGIKMKKNDEDEAISSEMENYIINCQHNSKMANHLDLLRKQKERKFQTENPPEN